MANVFTRIGAAIFGAVDPASDPIPDQPGNPELGHIDLDDPALLYSPDETVDGEDILKARASARPSSSIGYNGVTTVGGYVVSTSRDRLPAGKDRYDRFTEMVSSTSIIAAGVRLFLNLIAKSDWTVNPAEGQEENAQAKEYADLVYDMMFDMATPWSSIIRKTAMYRFTGFRIMEWTAKRRDDGNIGMADVEVRPESTIERWDIDPSGTVQGAFQTQANAVPEYLPRGKIIYAVDDILKEGPEGVGLFRHVWNEHHRLRSYKELEEAGFETDLRGIPVAYGPLGIMNEAVKNGTMDKSERSAMRKPLTDFINSHIRGRKSGLMLDSETYRTQDEAKTPSNVKKWQLELLQGDSQSFEAIAAAITRTIQEIARVLGVEHILLGSDGSGSLALAKSKVGTFYLTVTSTLGDLVEIFERDWLQPIADLNGWPSELVPSLGVAEIRDEDISEIVDALAKMAQAGAVLAPDDPAIGEIRDMIGLSRPTDESVEMAMDAAITRAQNPGTMDPEQQQQLGEDEKPVAKGQKWIMSRRSKVRSMRAKVAKRAKMREAA